MEHLSYHERRTYLDLKKNRVSVPGISSKQIGNAMDEIRSIAKQEVSLLGTVQFVEQQKSVTNSASGDLIVSENQRLISSKLIFSTPQLNYYSKTIVQPQSISELELQTNAFLKVANALSERKVSILTSKTLIVLSPTVLGKLLIEVANHLQSAPPIVKQSIDKDLSIYEDPLYPYSFTSTSIDDEGLRTQARWLFDSFMEHEALRSLDPRFIQNGGSGFKVGLNEVWPHHYSIPPTDHFTNLFLRGGWNRKEYLFGEKEYVLVEDANVQLNLRQSPPVLIIQILQGVLYTNKGPTMTFYGGTVQTELKTVFSSQNLSKEAFHVFHPEQMVTTYTGYAAIPKDVMKVLS